MNRGTYPGTRVNRSEKRKFALSSSRVSLCCSLRFTTVSYASSDQVGVSCESTCNLVSVGVLACCEIWCLKLVLLDIGGDAFHEPF